MKTFSKTGLKSLIFCLTILVGASSAAASTVRTCTEIANEVEMTATPAIINLFHDKRLPVNKGNRGLQALLESKIKALQKLAEEPCVPGDLDI